MPTFVDSITSHPGTLSMIVALPLFGMLAKLFGAKFVQISKWYLYIAVFAVVIVMNSMFFPFIGGKDFFFRFVTELALIFYVLAWAFEMREDELKNNLKAVFKKPLVIAVTAFVASFLLACVFAFDQHAAFWSNYERGEGGFQMAHYYIFFMLLVLSLRAEGDWKNIFRFSLAAAGVMILYGIAGSLMVPGFIGPYASGGLTVPEGWFHKLVDVRFQGSLGNPAYVAPYLLFAIFYAAYLWIKRVAGKQASWIIYVRYALMIVALIFFFLLAQTRGAFLGIGAGAFVLLLYFVIAGRAGLRKWSAAALLAFVAVAGIAFTFKDSSFVQQWPGSRLLQINLTDYTAQTRFWVWGEAWKGFQERPVFGWGPENFTPIFDKHFNPKFFEPARSTETWFDRAHSVYFDYLAETGALGLLSYLAIFIIFFWGFFKKRDTATSTAHKNAHVVERGLILALPIAYLVQGMAIFDVLPMYLNLFLFLAFATWYLNANHEHHANG